jgi:cell division protein FtsI/penicillin-binding protein 2
MRRSLIAAGAAAVLLAGSAVIWMRTHGGLPELPELSSLPPVPSEAPPIANTAAPKGPPAPPPLAGIDVAQLVVDDDGVKAPAAAGRSAKLTLEPSLQSAALAVLRAYQIPEAAVVVLEVATGKVLAYASHLEKGPTRDLCVEATAPAASVFKIVTGAALVEHAGLGPSTKQCYSGGEHRIDAADLIDDPKRDRACTTLAGAMGKSTNTVFARLAQKHLKHDQLESMARAFGFEGGVPFDLQVAPSALKLPAEPLGFARTAAGFWNTTLSPVAAAYISAAVARGGEPMRPYLVEEVRAPDKSVLYTAPAPSPAKRVVGRDVAAALTTMMEKTVSEGTSWKAFRDGSGRAFLPGVAVAGKTGTLSDPQAQRFYTWFTGFAPSRPTPGVKQIAIAALVVNGPVWRVKANVVAREVLRAHFAAENVPNVSRPSVATGKAAAKPRDAKRPAARPRKPAR